MGAAVVIVTGLFFVIGITVGVIIVVAMAGIKSERRAGPDDPDPGEDRRPADERPSWPGASGRW